MATTTAESFDTMYASIENLIHRLAWTFTSRYGGDFDEWLSVANCSCALALTRFDTTREIKLTTWVYRFVYLDLITEVEKRMQHCQRFVQLDTKLHDYGTYFSDLMIDLSNDAREVVLLFSGAKHDVLNLPVRTTFQSVRNAVKRYLTNQGWGEDRYNRTLDEIQEALT